MTKAQTNTVEYIRKNFMDWNHGHTKDSYEVKKFEVEETDYGTVIVYCVSGLPNDDGTMAAVLCRTTRQIFIGKGGGMRAYGKRSNGKKEVLFTKPSDVIIFGYRR